MRSRPVRPARIIGDVAFIPLTRGYEAIVDVADLPLVASRNWHAVVRSGTVYAVWTDASGNDQFMHRVIAQPSLGLVVDHVDGDGLHNRRANLRCCEHRDNIRNSRRRAYNALAAKGVFERGGRFVGRIEADGHEYHLGTYDTVEEARAAYFGAARVLFGQFANAG